MALTCWLPLLGTTENQGCGSITATNNGAVIDNNGKIGKCYSFNGNDYYIALTGQKLFDCFKGGTTAFSICMWVYHADTRRAILFGDYGLSNSIGFNIELNTGHGLRFYWNGSPDYSPGLNVGLNTWSHIALTYDGTSLKSYLNGNLVATRDGTLATRSKTVGEFRLGRDSRTTDTALNGKLNDIRVYGDHCLSPLEVKEIAQGLVLHYKLNNQHEINLRNKYSSPYSDGECSSSTWTKTKLTNERGWNYKLTKTGNGSNSWPNCGCPVFTFTSGKRHQYSVKVRCNKWTTGTLSLRASRSSNDWVTSAIIVCSPSLADGQWHEYCVSQIINDTYDRAGTTVTCAPVLEFYTSNMNGDGTIYDMDFDLKDIQVVESDTYVPFINNAFTSNSITDSSGYNHNGEILNGPLSLTSDTPRYNISTHFSATNQKIKISNFPTSGFGNSYTFTWWAKISSVTPMHWGFSDGIRLNGMYTGRLWNTGDSSNNPLYNPGTTTQVTAPTVNVWHHWAMTGDGTKCRVYQDGILWAEAKTYKAISGTTIYINGWNTSTDYSSNDYSISDFRIYCTPLLDTDIKQLYNVGMKVDKNQNIHTFEFNESAGKTQLKKTGVLKSALIADNLLFDNKAHIGKRTYENILSNDVDIVTTKSGHSKKGALAAIPAAKMQSLAGKTLRFIYDVKADGTRSSTENGQTAYNYTRYGIHASFPYTNASGTTGTSYPFAGELNYSGGAKHAIQTWTVPTGYQSYGALSFSIQNFDKPASTNNETWFIQNVRLEIVDNNTSDGYVTGTQIIER